MLATNSYMFIPYILPQHMMVGFFSSPQRDAYASQKKRSWFIIYESLYKTWKSCGSNTEGWRNFLCKQNLRTRKTCGIILWVTYMWRGKAIILIRNLPLNNWINTIQKPPTTYPKKLSKTNEKSHARRDIWILDISNSQAYLIATTGNKCTIIF